MKIITPVAVNDAAFVSCSVAEDDAPAWNAATAYTVGQKSIRPNHHLYERKVAGTTATAPESDPANWLDLGMTNRWRMFDQKVGTTTTATTTLTATLKPGIVNALALVNLSAASAQVRMIDPVEGVVYDKTFDLYDPLGITDWYAYFFEDIRRRDTLIVTDLPSYRNADVEVTLFDGVGQTVSVGALVVGKLDTFAESVLAGASVGIQDYSRKERDDWGNAYIVERAYARRANWTFVIANTDIDVLQRRLSALRAKPAIYIGSNRFDSTVIYGFFRDFDIVIPYPNHSECSIEIEGLT